MNKDLSSKVFYIDDDPDMIELVQLILSRKGYEVKGSTSGFQGLESIRNDPPDLILLDLMIPDLDGWDIYNKLKTDTNLTANIPVIIITAKSLPIDKILGINISKVDGYLAKPFLPQQLIACIQNVIEKNT